MISQLAKDDLEQLRADGLSPTVEDIIRLNALGLKLEAEAKKRPTDSTDYLPRVAVLDTSLTLRQPAIGHEVWLEKVRRFVADNDADTILALHAFALSRSVDDLPDGDDARSVEKAVAAFCRDCRHFSREQIFAAVEYATFGASPASAEAPARQAPDSAEAPARQAPDSSRRSFAEAEAEDWRECVAAGILAYGQIVLFGASVAELSRLTRRQVRDMIRRAYIFHGLETPNYLEIAQGDYYATLTAIRERLTHG